MATLKELLQQLDKKKAELDSLRPIKPEWQRKLDEKYRLEWNFHSNHIEGNTLTYGETQMLLFFGKATGEHEKRDYDEMEAHDAAIKIITEWAKEKDRDITESEIRELNKIILVKPFWKEAITPDGSPTRKEIVPGLYKSSPNSVRLKNGEIHNYASPEETPAKMNELFAQYVEDKGEHPLILAAKMHHGFTAIHPFDDGNGRVARLWVNYILLKNGFPPLIIRVENKEKYLTALQKADTGDLVPFILYLVEEMNWSLAKAIDAAQGNSIEEPGDVDKEIELFKRSINKELLFNKKKSQDAVLEVIQGSFLPLVDTLLPKIEKLNDQFFENNKRFLYATDINHSYNPTKKSGGMMLSMAQYPSSFRNWLSNPLNQGDKTLVNFDFEYSLTAFKLKPEYGLDLLVRCLFKDYEFRLIYIIQNKYYELFDIRYGDQLDETQIQEAVGKMIRNILKLLKRTASKE